MFRTTFVVCLSLGLAACGSPSEPISEAGTEESQSSSSVDPNLEALKADWAAASEACLSANQLASIDDAEVNDNASCARAEVIKSQLTEAGLCFGDQTLPRYQWAWRACTEADRFAASNPPPPVEPVYIQSLNIVKFFNTRVNGFGAVVHRDDYATIRLTAIVDEVTVYGATANRGNCNVRGGWGDGNTLRYGDTFEFYTDCDPIEVNINTSMGKVNTNW